mgnify:FL=1
MTARLSIRERNVYTSNDYYLNSILHNDSRESLIQASYAFLFDYGVQAVEHAAIIILDGQHSVACEGSV